MATAPKKIAPGTDENVINLDFRNVGPRGGGPAYHGPAGDYLLELVQAKNVPVKSKAGERQIAFQWRIVGTPDEQEARDGYGMSVYTNGGLGENQLWFLRNIIEDLTGKEVTGSALALKLDDKAGLRMGATLGDGRAYTDKNNEERVNSEIKYTFPAARFVGWTPSSGSGKAAAPKAESNGAASHEEAAEAVAESTAAEDEDNVDIQELASI